VKELNISNLIGTPLLKGYMHGFFMDLGLYNKLKAVSEPQAYEEWRKKKLKDKLEEKRKSRISIQKKLPKVNREYAQRVIHKAEKTGAKTKDAQNPLEDDRFSAMFTQRDFQIDEEAEEFKLRNPSGPVKMDEEESEDEVLGESFKEIEDSSSDEHSPSPSDSDAVFSESSDDDNGKGFDTEKGKTKLFMKQQTKGTVSSSMKPSKKQKTAAGRMPKFFEVDESENITDLAMDEKSERKQKINQKRLQKQRLLSQRLKEEEIDQDFGDLNKSRLKIQKGGGAVREMTFFPSENKSKTKPKSKFKRK